MTEYLRTGTETGRRAVIRGFAAFALALVLAGCAATGPGSAGQSPRNIIIMFADGVASTQWDFGRYSSRVLRNQPFVTTDVVFREGALGLLATSPLGPYVTDSAAAASAMSGIIFFSFSPHCMWIFKTGIP